DMAKRDRRHLNSSSDTELLLHVLAGELQATTSTVDLDPERIFEAVARTHQRIEGAYAVIAVIAGYGLLAFRDPFGIRPLILGRRPSTVPGAEGRDEWVVASESLVLENGDYEVVREVEPGEAVFITNDGELFTQQC
ncbi:amidophosphoribosyltransferase, partial [Leifsonia sp. ku-ls]